MRLVTLPPTFNQSPSLPSWGRGLRNEETLLRSNYPAIEISNNGDKVCYTSVYFALLDEAGLLARYEERIAIGPPAPS